MKTDQLTKRCGYALAGALVILGCWHTRALAHDDHGPAQQDLKNKASLVRIIRESTERFHDVRVAQAEGYALNFGCVSGSDAGAMGLHFVNGALLNQGVLDPTRPTIIIYEPLPNGTLRLIGVDFVVFADQWNASHHDPPQLMGQLFHLFESPNRFGLPTFFTLHVWAWKDNPTGMFVNWHTGVSCEAFNGQNP